MTPDEKLITRVLNDPQSTSFDKPTTVEIIDSKTGLVEATMTLIPGTYLVYDNLDIDEVGEVRRFVEDPTPLNRLLRLPERS